MRRLSLLFLAAAVPAAAAAASVVRFDPLQGLVEVEAVIDGHAKGRFGIDTGADHFYIDSAFAAAHGLNLASGRPSRAVVGIDGHSTAIAGQVRSLEIGDERLYNLDAIVMDIGALVKDDRADPPDGLIGYSLLRRFYVTVDYPNRRLILQQTEPDFLQSGGLPSVPFKTKGHLVVVQATFDDSATAPMALDYCASYVAVSPALAERRGVPAAAERTILGRLSLGGLITTDSVAVGIADISPIKARLRDAAFEGLIGASFLYRHKITIDYRRGRIYVHR